MRWIVFLSLMFWGTFAEQATANTSPVARPDTVRVEQNGRINVDVLANDADADGDSLVSQGFLTDAKHSRLLIRNTNGTIHYRPALEFVGQDSFVYLLSDGQNGLAAATVYFLCFPHTVRLMTR